jgi:hypothetical protein
MKRKKKAKKLSTGHFIIPHTRAHSAKVRFPKKFRRRLDRKEEKDGE